MLRIRFIKCLENGMDRFFGQSANAHGCPLLIDDLAACLMKQNTVVVTDRHGITSK